MIVSEIINVILPVFILLGIGFFVGRFMDIQTKPVSDLCIYVFSPALFFHSVTTSSLDLGDLGRIVLFALLLFVLFAVLIRLLGIVLGWNLSYRNTMMLASAFPNTGNYGLPIVLFAFGDEGMAIAIIYVVMQSLLMNSAGIFYASNHADVSKKAIFITIIRMPGFIAITIGLVLKIAGIAVPEALGNATGLLGQAAVPVLLTLLGITLASIQIKTVLKFIGTAAVLKLVAFPAIAFGLLAWLYPAGSLEAKVLLISAATPAAATTTLLAMKFNMNPDMVSSAMFVSTLASIVTIPALLLVL